MRGTLLLTILSLVITGCGGEDYPATYPVTGVVTYHEKPVEGADVVLVPSSPDIRSAGGSTDAEGKFTVQTYFDPQNQLEGAMTGEYTVTISKQAKADIPQGLKPEEEMAYYMKHGQQKSPLPKKYSTPATSGFKVSVGDAPPEPLMLELKD